eukprot:368443_1
MGQVRSKETLRKKRILQKREDMGCCISDVDMKTMMRHECSIFKDINSLVHCNLTETEMKSLSQKIQKKYDDNKYEKFLYNSKNPSNSIKDPLEVNILNPNFESINEARQKCLNEMKNEDKEYKAVIVEEVTNMYSDVANIIINYLFDEMNERVYIMYRGQEYQFYQRIIRFSIHKHHGVVCKCRFKKRWIICMRHRRQAIATKL